MDKGKTYPGSVFLKVRLPDATLTKESNGNKAISISFILLPCWQAKPNRFVRFASGLALPSLISDRCCTR